MADDWIRFAPPEPGIERIAARFAGHAYDPHRHDTYAVGLTTAGVQSFDYRGARADSLAGDVVVIHPDERHDGRAGADGGFAYRMLYVEPRLVMDALAGRARSLPFVAGGVSRDPRLAAAIAPALADIDRPLEPLASDHAVQALAEALLALDPGAAKDGPGAASAAAVERARRFLDASCTRVVASEELERATGLDRWSLARHFRRLLGTSPYRYLTMRRLDRARERLRAGDGLAEAAAACGFADQSHMTRQFRAAYGMSPGRWRQFQEGH
ncbi:MAG: AraC family transcriptional regulator, partial [Alphaproteobacteria bacterium]